MKRSEMLMLGGLIALGGIAYYAYAKPVKDKVKEEALKEDEIHYSKTREDVEKVEVTKDYSYEHAGGTTTVYTTKVYYKDGTVTEHKTEVLTDQQGNFVSAKSTEYPRAYII